MTLRTAIIESRTCLENNNKKFNTSSVDLEAIVSNRKKRVRLVGSFDDDDSNAAVVPSSAHGRLNEFVFKNKKYKKIKVIVNNQSRIVELENYYRDASSIATITPNNSNLCYNHHTVTSSSSCAIHIKTCGICNKVLRKKVEATAKCSNCKRRVHASCACWETFLNGNMDAGKEIKEGRVVKNNNKFQYFCTICLRGKEESINIVKHEKKKNDTSGRSYMKAISKNVYNSRPQDFSLPTAFFGIVSNHPMKVIADDDDGDRISTTVAGSSSSSNYNCSRCMPLDSNSISKLKRYTKSIRLECQSPPLNEDDDNCIEAPIPIKYDTSSNSLSAQKNNRDKKTRTSVSELSSSMGSSSANNSRAARAMQRSLLKGVSALKNNVAGNSSSSILDFNGLSFREPDLRFGKSPIHSWGVFAEQDISSGDMILEYRGELIGNAVADKREKEYEQAKIGSDYMFRIDKETVCDATKKGSLARFINASCSPNCYTKIISYNGSKRIVIYAKRAIKKGEELCYDYKFAIEYDPSKRIPCHCGAKECRGFMNWNKKYVLIPENNPKEYTS